MNLLAIVGSPRIGKATDTLVDKAIEGFRSKSLNCSVKRKAVIIVTSGIVPPMYRKFCDWATNQIKGVVIDSLNGKIVGDMYAGDIEHRGVEHYFDKAFKLGKRLV